MKYVQLLNQRINLENIAHYYPQEVEKTNTTPEFYVIRFILNAGGSLNLQYTRKEQRDEDLKMLDFICVENKRGDVKELRKVQQ